MKRYLVILITAILGLLSVPQKAVVQQETVSAHIDAGVDSPNIWEEAEPCLTNACGPYFSSTEDFRTPVRNRYKKTPGGSGVGVKAANHKVLSSAFYYIPCCLPTVFQAYGRVIVFRNLRL